MGLDIQNAKFLSLCKRLGADFSSTLTFGHQEVLVADRMKMCPLDSSEFIDAIKNDRYADTYLRFLGARKLDICDASPYEGANIILDLNRAPPDYMESSYSCVIDLGTLEHIFHYSRALQTAMTCVSEGGHLIIATPANNLMGHGFYQLSPELYLRSFTEENGFELVKMVLADQFEESPWYDINLAHRPTKLATRYLAPSSWAPTYLMVLAKRKSIRPIFATAPQQISYELMWNDSSTLLDQPTGSLSHPSRKFFLIIVSLIKKNHLMLVYRRLRAFLEGHELPSYYQKIPSKVWKGF